MDSRAWTIASGLVAAALAALLVRDIATEPDEHAVATRIVPEWNARQVRAIRIEGPGKPAIRLERATSTPSSPTPGSDAGWSLRLPATGRAVPVDATAARDLLGTIELLSAIRRDAGRVDHPRLTVTIEREGRPAIRLLVAAAGPGPTDRVWLGRAGEGGRFLIDGYAVRALDRGVDDLRERRPLRGRIDGATRIEVTTGDASLILSGPPWKVALPGGAAAAAPDAVEGFLGWARRLRIDQFADDVDVMSSEPSGQPSSSPATRIAIDARSGRSEIHYGRRGSCPGGTWLADTPVGRGCLPLEDSLAERAAHPASWVDRNLVEGPIDRVTRLRLERGGRAIAIDRADSPDALRTWLTRWRDAAAGPVVPADGWTPFATVALDTDGGSHERITVGHVSEGRVAARRDGEPVALLLHPWAAGHLDPAPHRFRPLDLLPYEPSALRAAAARRAGVLVESIERGDTLEEWRAVAPTRAAVRLPAVEALRQAVGFLRAERFESPRARPSQGLSPPRRTVDLVFDPPPGDASPTRHTVDIGALGHAGTCHARLDRDPTVFELSPGRCAALLGPWTRARARRAQPLAP